MDEAHSLAAGIRGIEAMAGNAAEFAAT